MTNRELLEDAGKLRYEFEEAFELMALAVEKHLSSAPPVIRNYTAHLAKSTGKFIRAYGLMACSMAGRVLDCLGVENHRYARWKEKC